MAKAMARARPRPAKGAFPLTTDSIDFSAPMCAWIFPRHTFHTFGDPFQIAFRGGSFKIMFSFPGIALVGPFR